MRQRDKRVRLATAIGQFELADCLIAFAAKTFRRGGSNIPLSACGVA